ncbi:MAG: protein kinase [candidate division KSB1 bacterium]|nr:protein kinase [candidate division KSB1 bacterium]MDZ7304039.1 protein kinase [candidate division KSB1 bacterium]MDZ7313250.1 protein kinase [candidate division KSB1 bacterium]
MNSSCDRNPFVIGQWVRGEKFFGREEMISELLEGARQAVWVAGLRRMGKTSLLREIERRVLQNPATGYLPLYWDLEGSTDDETLRESLLAALDENVSGLAAAEDWEALSTPELLRKIQKVARAREKTLLLLCDEVEALLTIANNDPHLLGRLRRVMQASESVRCILTATRRLSRLETFEATATSPFLHGFSPPLYLSPLNELEAKLLLRQGGFPSRVQKELYELSGGHPFLLQMLAKRTLESGAVESAFESMKHEESLQNFFIVDYNSLQPEEKLLLRHCAGGKVSTATTEAAAKQTLLALGLISEHEDMLQLRSPLFNFWLANIRDEISLPTTKSHAVDFRNLQRGDRLGPYEILHEVARGGMSVVYCGRDIHLHRLAAIKLLPPELSHDETSRARLLAEARAISQLQHPHVAVIYSMEFLDETPCLCMEYIDGQSLDDWAQHPPKSLDQRLEVVRQIASALAAAHRNGIIHRDLKPSNIMVRPDGISKLLDFGIARQLATATRITKTGQTPGTLAYMSPEQVSNLDVDARSDVFSFGVVLYELFTGMRPFQGNNELALAYAIVNEKPAPPCELQPTLPKSLENLILRMLQKKPEARFADGGELLQELEKIK